MIKTMQTLGVKDKKNCNPTNHTKHADFFLDLLGNMNEKHIFYIDFIVFFVNSPMYSSSGTKFLYLWFHNKKQANKHRLQIQKKLIFALEGYWHFLLDQGHLPQSLLLHKKYTLKLKAKQTRKEALSTGQTTYKYLHYCKATMCSTKHAYTCKTSIMIKIMTGNP